MCWVGSCQLLKLSQVWSYACLWWQFAEKKATSIWRLEHRTGTVLAQHSTSSAASLPFFFDPRIAPTPPTTTATRWTIDEFYSMLIPGIAITRNVGNVSTIVIRTWMCGMTNDWGYQPGMGGAGFWSGCLPWHLGEVSGRQACIPVGSGGISKVVEVALLKLRAKTSA